MASVKLLMLSPSAFARILSVASTILRQTETAMESPVSLRDG
jgi:hypothetical protein